MNRNVQHKHSGGAVCMMIVLLAASSLSAQDSFSIYWENDSRYIKPNGNTDRHYTNGFKLVYTTQPEWQWLKDFGDWNAAANAVAAEKAVGFFLGQNIYTPDHASNPERRKDEDRVFAGWLYTGMFVQRRAGDTLDHVELNVGVVGPSSRADRTQKCIHEVINSDEVIGWDSQLSDEPAADFTWVRKQRQTEGILAPTEHTDAITDIGFTAGSLHRNIEAGIMVRLGAELPKDFGPGRLTLPSSTAAGDPNAARSIYLFARLAARAVEHDRFLSGLTPRPLVGLASAGIVCQLGDFEIAYSQTFLTPEYKEHKISDSFGALTVTWLF